MRKFIFLDRIENIVKLSVLDEKVYNFGQNRECCKAWGVR